MIPPVDDIVDLIWRDEPGYVLVVEKEVHSASVLPAAMSSYRLLRLSSRPCAMQASRTTLY